MATSENHKYRLTSLENTGFLGKGTYGTVLLVNAAHSQRPLALKCVSMSKIDQMGHQAHILAERAVMANLDHPFMPKLYGTFRDSLNVYLLTDYFSGGDLLELYMASFPFSAEAVRFFTCSIVCMLDYLHHKQIVYRDLKLENVMLDSHGYLNLVDFGLSKMLEIGERTYTICGTPMYIAPEVVQKTGHGHTADWWTLGVLIYELQMGFTPFSNEGKSDNTRTIFKNIVDPAYHFRFTRSTPPGLRSLVRMLLSHNPLSRIGFQAHAAGHFVRQHEYFAGFDWKGLLERRTPAPVLPSNKRRSNHPHDPFDLKSIPPYTPPVETKGCLCTASSVDVACWHDVFV